MGKMKKQTYDLEERLIEYSVRTIKIVEQLPNTITGNHFRANCLDRELHFISKRLKRNRNSY